MAMAYMHSLRHIPRDVCLTMVTEAIGYGVAFGVFGVLLNLYLLRMGYGPQFIGLVNGAGWMGMMLGAPLAGPVSRRWGARRTMIVGFCGGTAGFGLVGLADLVPAGFRDVGLPIAYGLSMASVTLYLVNVSVYIMAVTDAASRNHAFALRSAVGPLGAALLSLLSGALPGLIAPALGLTLNDPGPYRWVLAGGGLLQVLGVLALLLTRELGWEGRGESVDRASPFPWLALGIISLVAILRWGANGPATTFLNVYLDEGLGVATSSIGLVRAIGQAVSVPAALAMPVLAGRWGRPRLLSVTMLAMGFCAVPLALVPNIWAASLFFLGLAGLQSVGNAAMSPYGQSKVAPEWRATLVGTTMMASGLGAGIMSFGGGVAIAALGYRELFLASAVAALLGALLVWGYERRRAA